jgi:hypothetical protein
LNEIYISQVDALFSGGLYPIEFLFFYSDRFSTAGIRRALKRLSSTFWPVFGEYREGRIFFERYREEDVFGEEEAAFLLDIEAGEGVESEIVDRFRQQDLKRLFFLKAIQFKNGTGLIPKLNHLAGDGYSYFHFLSALAALSRPAWVPFRGPFIKLKLKPHHGRTVLRSFRFRGTGAAAESRDERFDIAREMISRDEVRSLAKEPASVPGPRVSSNDILTARALKRLIGRRPEEWGDDIRLTIPIDVRRRIDEYGRRFFGNGIMLHSMTLGKEQVLDFPLRETALRIRRSVPDVTRQSYIGYLESLEHLISAGRPDLIRPFDPNKGCLVTNLSRLPAARLDFGTGPPASIFPLTIEKNSAGILAEHDNYVLRLVY